MDTFQKGVFPRQYELVILDRNLLSVYQKRDSARNIGLLRKEFHIGDGNYIYETIGLHYFVNLH